MARKKGLKCSKNNFWVAIRNPVYCGLIFIPKYKDEDSKVVKGLHTPLISETLFNRVQDVLDGRKRQPTNVPKVTSHELLPLRGFLACPKCGDSLTGSGSRGRSQYYYYYHCKSTCGFREKAEIVNEAFYKELEKYTPQPAIAELYKKIVLTSTTTYNRKLNKKIKEVSDQIEEQNRMVQKARVLMLHDKIDPDEYREIKKEVEGKITALESQVANCNVAMEDLKGLLNNAINALIKLGD